MSFILATAQNRVKNEASNLTVRAVKFKSSYRPMTKKFGAKKLGFYTEILNPKTFTCPYHWHTTEEEMVIVLEGEATVRNNGEFRVIKPGDMVFYGTGPASVHHMYNHTDKPFKYFVLSSLDEADECFYPDSNKQTSPNGVLQNGEKVDYYKDEADPSVYWPKDRL